MFWIVGIVCVLQFVPRREYLARVAFHCQLAPGLEWTECAWSCCRRFSGHEFSTLSKPHYGIVLLFTWHVYTLILTSWPDRGQFCWGYSMIWRRLLIAQTMSNGLWRYRPEGTLNQPCPAFQYWQHQLCVIHVKSVAVMLAYSTFVLGEYEDECRRTLDQIWIHR